MSPITDPRFQAALAGVFKEEGGYANVKGDAGGETNFGIADMRDGVPDGMTDIDGDGKPDTRLKDLTKEQAADIYWREYWLECACNLYPPPLDWIVFDSAVQHSPALAVEFRRQAGNDAKRYLAIRRQFYLDLIKRKPVNEKFRRGWMNRLDHLATLIPA